MTYTIDYVGGACPTQAWGRTADDRPFYFRARHGEWTLEIGNTGWPTDYSDWPRVKTAPPWFYAEGADPSFGWMEPAQVERILAEHLG